MGTRKISLLLCALFAFTFFIGGRVLADSVSDTQLNPAIVINEIQTNGVGVGKTTEEFIELVNVSDQAVAMDSWKLQFISSTGNLSTAKIFLTLPAGFSISPGGRVLICPDSYATCEKPSITYVTNSSFSGLSSTGGSLVLINSANERVDLVGWGTNASTKFETLPATAPPDGQSIQRKSELGVPTDTNNNCSDFVVQNIPSPSNDNPQIIAPPDEDVEPTPTPTPSVLPTPTPSIEPEIFPSPIPTPTPAVDEQPAVTDTPAVPKYQTILINELYIDPVSPETDSKDEWVELYNPNDTSQDLLGYTVYAGETFAYHHTFTTSTVIQPHGYIVVTSGDTSIALANSDGAVKLTDPNNLLLDQTSYENSKPGMAWAKTELGTWQWTTTPTSVSQNIITIAVDPIVAVTAAAKKVAKTTSSTTKASATPKLTATKKAATTTAKATKVKAASSSADEPAVIEAPSPLPIWLLAVIGGLAVIYSLYEYRFEIANKIYQFKQYRIHRKTNR